MFHQVYWYFPFCLTLYSVLLSFEMSNRMLWQVRVPVPTTWVIPVIPGQVTHTFVCERGILGFKLFKMAIGGKGLEKKVLISIVLLTISTLFQLIGLASDNWVDTVHNEFDVVGSSGLWRVCTSFGDAYGLPNDRCRGFVWTDNQVSRKLQYIVTLLTRLHSYSR